MCHSSCLTCSTELFTACTSCSGSNVLYNSACYCSSALSSDCSSQLMFEGVFKFGDSILKVCFIFIVIMYCLKAKLPISYRVISGLQGLALLIYSSNMYLDYEDFFVLKTFNFLSGPYKLDYRLQNLSNQHSMQVYILLAFFFVLFIIFYKPVKTFIPQTSQQTQSYFAYLKSYSLQFLQNFYYFGSKFIWFYIGMFIQQNDNSISVIVSLCIFGLICLVCLGKVFYAYHYDKIDQSIFSCAIYIYCMLSNSIYVGLSLISTGQSSMLYLIYSLPVGVLLLVLLLNKQSRILQRKTIKFIVIEVIIAAISIAFILVGNTVASYILLALIFICLLIIVIECSVSYYGGLQFQNTKVHPINNDQNVQKTQEEMLPHQFKGKNRNDQFF